MSDQTHKSKTVGNKKRAAINPRSGRAAKAGFPENMQPMLATLGDKPFDTDDWSYEVKWDGYRALALINKKQVELKSRNDKSFNKKFYPIYDEIREWNTQAVIDGEIVVVNSEGIPDFGALQNWRSEADGALMYYVFDMLWLNGRDLTKLPLMERREILKANLPGSDMIRVSESFPASGTEFYKIAEKNGAGGYYG